MKDFYKLPKKSAKRYCDEIWSLIIKIRDGKKCIHCNNENNLNSHHLLTRKIHKYRYDLNNGVCMCAKCHQFDIYFSPRFAPWEFEEWIKINRPFQYAYWINIRNKIKESKDISLIESYETIYFKLEEEYKKLTGNYLRKELSIRYILKGKEKEIIDRYAQGFSSISLAKIYNVSKSCILDLLNRNSINLRHYGRKPKGFNPYLNISEERKIELREKRIKYYGKPIRQLSLNRNVIAEFRSINEAERKTGIYNNTIRNVLRGSGNTAGGYLWEYINV